MAYDVPTIEVDTSELTPLTALLRDGPARVSTFVGRALVSNMQWGLKRATEKVSGDLLQRRTGRLAMSLSYSVEAASDALIGRLGILKGAKEIPYAVAQEYGATIKPTAGHKVLTIPLEASLTAAGVARWTALGAKSQFQGGTRWLKSSTMDHPILFGFLRQGQKGAGKFRRVQRGLSGLGTWLDKSMIPLFVGVPEVTIKPKRYLGSTAEEMVPLLRAEIERNVVGALLAERQAQ